MRVASRKQLGGSSNATFTMAALAAVLRLWMTGRERDAFVRFESFGQVPEGLSGIVAFPDRPMPPAPCRSPWGDAWLVQRYGDLKQPTTVPVVGLRALRLFVLDYMEWRQRGTGHGRV